MKHVYRTPNHRRIFNHLRQLAGVDARMGGCVSEGHDVMFFPEATDAAKVIVAAIDRNTAAIDRLNQTLLKVGETMSQDVTDLIAEVAAVKGVAASAVTFIQGIVAKLEAAQGDSVAIQQAIQDLKDGTQPLADAIAANPA